VYRGVRAPIGTFHHTKTPKFCGRRRCRCKPPNATSVSRFSFPFYACTKQQNNAPPPPPLRPCTRTSTFQTNRVDIYNRLYRERIIFLGSEIDDELANQVIGVMLYLDNEDSDKPIYLYINSPGGSVISGLAIYDCMQHIKSEVITINLGLAASMASFILAAGSKGKRLALPSSRTMIHQPMGGAQGQAQDIKVEAGQILRIRDNLVKMYSMMTGQTQDQVVKDLDRDNFMSAYQAMEYGLVDRVLDYNKERDTQL
jgi:ATP-dependent Clp protease, protease subunit